MPDTNMISIPMEHGTLRAVKTEDENGIMIEFVPNQPSDKPNPRVIVYRLTNGVLDTAIYTKWDPEDATRIVLGNDEEKEERPGRKNSIPYIF